MIRFVDGGPRAENYSGRIDFPQFRIRLARGSWTNLSEFRSTLSRSGVGSETRPLREAMVSETTQSPHPLVVRQFLKNLILGALRPASWKMNGSRTVLKN